MFRSCLFGLRFRWRRRRGPALEHLHFVFYTRQGCHLCHVAWEQIQTAQHRYGFTLDEVDVDGDPALAEQYGGTVPVITVNGKMRFRGVVNLVFLNRLLRAEQENAGKALDNRLPPTSF
jgi:glutaredoxin